MISFDELYREYRKPGVRAIYTKIPIVELQLFRLLNAKLGKFYRIRYRGPRKNDKGRSLANKASTCLKQNATAFSVYRY